MSLLNYTIYRKPLLSETRIGITFKPTPGMSISELRYLILTLQELETQMVGNRKWAPPSDFQSCPTTCPL